MADDDRNAQFLAALANLGGSAGNGRLRETLRWDEATYITVQSALIACGAIVPGRGRGGSVTLANRTAAVRQPDFLDPPATPAEPAAKPTPRRAASPAGPLGIVAQLFLAADKLRKNLEPSDYKHVALGLIFLKHISLAFEARRAALLAEDPTAAEDPDEYLAENVF